MWTVRIENKMEVKTFFDGLASIEDIDVLNKLATAVGYSFRKDWRNNFQKEGIHDYRYGFSKWKPLKPATIRDRIRQGYGASPILQRTKRLYNSIVKKSHGENISIVRGGTGYFGTSVPYGIYHQSYKPRKKLPRRQFVGVSEKMNRQITRMAGYLIYVAVDLKRITWREIYNFGQRGTRI